MAQRDGNRVPSGRDSGAALLIIVAILAIIAALSIGTRYFGGATRGKAQRADLMLEADVITNAIAAFWGMYSRLPCPADITANDGAEAGDGTAGCDALAASLQTIPWKTLGIPQKSVFDPWGNYLAYHVDPALVLTGATGAGTLTVKNSAAGANIVTNAIFVLISMGPNGAGAYTSNLVLKAASTDADELENTDGDTVYVKGGTPGGNYDDTLVYWIWSLL
ncbi:MAG: hypothetical protein HQL45_10450 [Alphaproteobacteria bacterium]|jgi:hypothetical protein|nr:hypothetical protein [Alphaproteobacteria bacterium]